MESKSLIRSMVLLAAVAISVPAFAKPMAKNLPLNHSVTVGKSEVKAGEYRFVIDDNHLTIMNGKKVVAESNGRWEERDKKYDNAQIVSNGEGKVIEVRFAGQKSAFVLAD
jgi:hypothetical protein